MEQDMQGKLFSVIESATSYVTVVLVFAFTSVVDNASTIMTLGGLVLLGLRLYVDTINAKKAYRDNQELSKGMGVER